MTQEIPAATSTKDLLKVGQRLGFIRKEFERIKRMKGKCIGRAQRQIQNYSKNDLISAIECLLDAINAPETQYAKLKRLFSLDNFESLFNWLSSQAARLALLDFVALEDDLYLLDEERIEPSNVFDSALEHLVSFTSRSPQVKPALASIPPLQISGSRSACPPPEHQKPQKTGVVIYKSTNPHASFLNKAWYYPGMPKSFIALASVLEAEPNRTATHTRLEDQLAAAPSKIKANNKRKKTSLTWWEKWIDSSNDLYRLRTKTEVAQITGI